MQFYTYNLLYSIFLIVFDFKVWGTLHNNKGLLFLSIQTFGLTAGTFFTDIDFFSDLLTTTIPWEYVKPKLIAIGLFGFF